MPQISSLSYKMMISGWIFFSAFFIFKLDTETFPDFILKIKNQNNKSGVSMSVN